jgi:hypothetical protein
MRAFVVSSADIARCPRKSFAPAHFNDDGSCRCQQKAWVVSYAPFEERGAIGGFEWRVERVEAEAEFDRLLPILRNTHRIRLVEVEIDLRPDEPRIAAWNERVTARLDSKLEQLELTLPALREHVPT